MAAELRGGLHRLADRADDPLLGNRQAVAAEQGGHILGRQPAIAAPKRSRDERRRLVAANAVWRAEVHRWCRPPGAVASGPARARWRPARATRRSGTWTSPSRRGRRRLVGGHEDGQDRLAVLGVTRGRGDRLSHVRQLRGERLDEDRDHGVDARITRDELDRLRGTARRSRRPACRPGWRHSLRPAAAREAVRSSPARAAR